MSNPAALLNRPGSRSAEPLRLLVAAHEPTQRLLLTQALSRAGYEVDEARDGKEALALLRSGDYALLVTDWDMPGVDGAPLCHEIRSSPLNHHVYIVVLTEHDQQADVVRGLDAGADDHVRKSAPAAELLARLSAGARVVRLERSLRAAQARIELMSDTDPVLPLYNRRYLAAELAREIERTRRYGGPLSIILADLDHLKRINDTFGHLAGDAVLLGFVSVTRTLLRTSDWAARFGGEEFVIVLPGTEADGAVTAAERIRQACAAKRTASADGEIWVTASFGVATLAESSDSPRSALEALLNSADEALYACKSAGRNCVRHFDRL